MNNPVRSTEVMVHQSRPYEEPLPKAFERPIEPTRFEEPNIDYFWPLANWVFGSMISLMGVCLLKDMFTQSYNWYLAIAWTGTAISGLAGLAAIHKWILNK